MLERVWRKGNIFTLLVGIQTSTATMENSVEIPLKNWKQNYHAAAAAKSLQSCPTLCDPIDGSLPGSDPAIPLLGIHTEETRIERDTCTPMFIAALFIIARTWKQPRCSLAHEWIRKLWYIYTMQYYSAIKKSQFQCGG